MLLMSHDWEVEPGRSALIGPARGCRRRRGRSDSERCRLEREGREGREGEGWEVRRGRRRRKRWGRWGRGHRGQEVEETAAAARPTGSLQCSKNLPRCGNSARVRRRGTGASSGCGV